MICKDIFNRFVDSFFEIIEVPPFTLIIVQIFVVIKWKLKFAFNFHIYFIFLKPQLVDRLLKWGFRRIYNFFCGSLSLCFFIFRRLFRLFRFFFIFFVLFFRLSLKRGLQDELH